MFINRRKVIFFVSLNNYGELFVTGFKYETVLKSELHISVSLWQQLLQMSIGFYVITSVHDRFCLSLSRTQTAICYFWVGNVVLYVYSYRQMFVHFGVSPSQCVSSSFICTYTCLRLCPSTRSRFYNYVSML